MILEANKKLVSEFFDAIASADTARMDELMTDDATWWVAPSTIFSGLHKKKDFLELLPQLFEQSAGPLTFKFGDYTAEDNRVSLTAKGNMLTNSGKTYECDYHFLIYIRDGKVEAGKEYLDSAHVGDVFGYPEKADA